jgi:ferredoxin-NADP reductase
MSGGLWALASTSVLAIATTIHVGLFLLSFHRRVAGGRHVLLLLPSLALSVSPWILPTVGGTAFGLVVHFLWVGASQRLLSDPPRQTPHRDTSRSAPRPQTARSPAQPRGFIQVPVIHVMRETDDITTFRMARPEGFEFKAGQFLTVRVNVDGKPVMRCYTISSAPETRGYLEISVKRQGLLSGTLHATVRAGSMLAVKAAAGHFVYPDGDDRPLALIAGGVGITPMMCMVRHAIQTDPTRPVTLLYSVHTHRDVAFRDELRVLAARNPSLRVRVTTTRGPHETGQLSGRIDGMMIAKQVPDITNTVFMICGPGPMIASIRTALAGLGVPEAQVRSEAFEAAIASSAADAAPQADDNPPLRQKENDFQLHLVDTGTTLPASCSATLLESCEAAGVAMPAVCRAGVCGTCRTRLASGKVRCESETLDESDRAAGYILPCVSWPEEDCALEA